MNIVMQLLPWILIFGIMYLFFLRPQIKKQKEQTNFQNNLKKGDQVVTGSGIIGRITKVEELAVELQIDSKSFMKLLKSAISKEATESIKDKNLLEH
ncbi:MAG: preprotein translocase subunit YajC [Saprospiraceae bacterium]|jgi:preprotein translocase subunit YajC|uniref:Sec translocon accessory complex subunit YajC n=1 Tax=Candidatus Defluviibacterium haderslevense TaxID=2981993 RepID=A0A9D7S9K9_9BACT|nr:preprotein translocase subunit YajC [Candidatus Defluviibacterium haderslevense]MCC7028071.1 preprotein translocase subunit YajC [Saprospiraceae bacterium]MBK7243916.1 preprotein translocase subunit YajC [Candidatus Defluviibacterium haderslevense]MBK8245137.1 preprotein translocase subunit YajC [Candidatus Defluviibacterium haderslevense]MBK9717652.1 preprotein translocase subunit YajC [Candidatus Defluviibacterium haderslevense]